MERFIEYSFRIREIVLACYVPPGKGEPVHRNRPSHGFAFFSAPRTFVFADGRVVTVRANELIYLPKGCSYDVTVSNVGGCYAINFQLEDDPQIPMFVTPLKNAERFLESFRSAELMWKTKRIGSYEKCAQVLYGIICDLKQEMSAEYMPKSRAAMILPAILYINEHYTFENIGIAHLAALCGISEVYLRRIFRNVYGVSPIRYINALKLSRARELILSGEYSIGEAAALSGFFDDSYFSREFRKAFGISPKELLPKAAQSERCNHSETEDRT